MCTTIFLKTPLNGIRVIDNFKTAVLALGREAVESSYNKEDYGRTFSQMLYEGSCLCPVDMIKALNPLRHGADWLYDYELGDSK